MAAIGRSNEGLDLRLGQGEEYELRACDEPTYNLNDERESKIVGWRWECFENAGMTNLDAGVLAVRRDVDREQVERMLREGATSTQVRDIVL